MDNELPKILYKYRTWKDENHKRILTHSEIYFASPDELHKATECILIRDYDSITKENIWKYCEQTVLNEYKDKEISNYQLLTLIIEKFNNNKFYDLEHRVNSEKKFRDDLNKELSIFCTSLENNNESLWENFGGLYTGFCVGIDFTKIYSDDNKFGSCNKVNYYKDNNPPIISPLTNSSEDRVQSMLKIIYNLPDRFKDEKEFRLTKMNIKNRKVIINPNFIKEIILGSDMDSKSKNEILKIARKKYPNAILKKTFIEPTFRVLTIVDY